VVWGTVPLLPVLGSSLGLAARPCPGLVAKPYLLLVEVVARRCSVVLLLERGSLIGHRHRPSRPDEDKEGWYR